MTFRYGSILNLKFVFGLLVTVTLTIGCSGDRANSQYGVRPVSPVASVRVSHDQIAMLEEATGVPRYSDLIRNMLSDRGAGLSATGGVALSATFMQSTMELIAAFCLTSAIEARNNRPQKVFPTYVKFTAPSVANFPEAAVVQPLAKDMLERFSGEPAPAADVAIMTKAINDFLAIQRTEGRNSADGVERAMASACTMAAMNVSAVAN